MRPHVLKTAALALPSRKFANPGDESDGVFAGLASTFGGEPDSYGDVVAAGAFDESLNRYRQTGRLPPMLWNHDQSEPIGQWLSLRSTDEGLAASGRLELQIERARNAHALLRSGTPLGLSIGYRVREGGAELVGGVRLLQSVDLVEISLVSLPANDLARVDLASVKAAPLDLSAATPRDMERALRDGLGLSAREAKRLMSAGWSGLTGTDDQDVDHSPELAAIETQIRELTAALSR